MISGTLFFEYGPQGWSETHYCDTADLAVARTRLDSLALARAKLLSEQVNIKYGRVCVVDAAKLYLRSNVAGAGILYGTQAGPPEDVFTALLTRGRTNDGQHRSLLMRGIPDNWVTAGVLSSAGIAGVAANFPSYRGSLLQASFWGIRKVSYGATKFALAMKNDATQGGLVKVSFTEPHGFTENSLIKVSGCKTNRMINRQWRVIISPEFPTTQIFLAKSKNLGVDDVGRFACKSLTYQFIPYASFFSEDRIVKKSTGRPFGLLRGRGAARVQLS